MLYLLLLPKILDLIEVLSIKEFLRTTNKIKMRDVQNPVLKITDSLETLILELN